MRRPRVAVSTLSGLREALTVAGDIRSDIEFQNDVNALLAEVSRLTSADGASRSAIRVPSDHPTPTPTPTPATPTPTPELTATHGRGRLAV